MNNGIHTIFLSHPFFGGKFPWGKVLLHYFVLVGTILLLTQSNHLLQKGSATRYGLGDTVKEDIILEHSLAFIDQKSSEKRLEQALRMVSPVYILRKDITDRTMKNFLEFRSLFRKEGGPSEWESLRMGFPGVEQLRYAYEVDSKGFVVVLDKAQEILWERMDQGMIDQEGKEWAGVDLIELIDSDMLRRRIVDRESRILKPWSPGERFLSENSYSPTHLGLLERIVNYFSEANTFFSPEMTEDRRQEIRENITPIWVKLNQGDTLVPRGGVIGATELGYIEAYLALQKGLKIRDILFPFLFVALLMVLMLVLIVVFPELKGVLSSLQLMFTFSIFHMAVTIFLYDFFSVPGDIPAILFAPTALVFTLYATLTGTKDAIPFILCQALLIFFVLNFNSQALYMVFFSGIGAVLVMEGAQKRIDLIKGGAYIGCVQFFLVGLLMLALSTSYRVTVLSLGVAAANGFLTGFLVLMILPLFEYILNPCTTFRLQELSDLNAPILKRMLAVAPGTYSHSMNVANLAEVGCRAIGANALLARVGAYYHDIGKIDQAKYFTENQKDYNKHDDLKFSLSVAVIKAHVKVGIEMARKLNLPERVIDIIPQHHGTSVIEYFYQQAVKERGADNVTIEDYSYNGPKPQTKEAAVVMLADIAEAATRSLKNPSAPKLDKFIWELMMGRFRAGELTDSSLTLKELEMIQSAFVQVLVGQYHTRIAYPEQEKS